MATLIEMGRSEAATMSTSSRDIFRLNPPQTFTYTDFVVKAPLPRVPQGMTEQAAKYKYPRTRLKRLIRVVEARLGKNRCFFREFQPRDKKKNTHFEITKLYALYEVEHWPGALAQYEWTQFVIANMERDATHDQVGHDAKLACTHIHPWVYCNNPTLICSHSANATALGLADVPRNDAARGSRMGRTYGEVKSNQRSGLRWTIPCLPARRPSKTWA